MSEPVSINKSFAERLLASPLERNQMLAEFERFVGRSLKDAPSKVMEQWRTWVFAWQIARDTEIQKVLEDSEKREAFADALVEDLGVTESLLAVVNLKNKHAGTWRDKKEAYWFQRLMDKVEELSDALVGTHEHPPETELMQIAAICLNWLEMREEKKCQECTSLRKQEKIILAE